MSYRRISRTLNQIWRNPHLGQVCVSKCGSERNFQLHEPSWQHIFLKIFPEIWICPNIPRLRIISHHVTHTARPTHHPFDPTRVCHEIAQCQRPARA